MVLSHTAAHEEAVGFEPSEWSNFFINYEPQPLQRSETWMQERAEKLKGDIRTLFGTFNDVSARMNLVDSVQHLGIDRLFQEQIEDALMSNISGSEFRSLVSMRLLFGFACLGSMGFGCLQMHSTNSRKMMGGFEVR